MQASLLHLTQMPDDLGHHPTARARQRAQRPEQLPIRARLELPKFFECPHAHFIARDFPCPRFVAGRAIGTSHPLDIHLGP
jgi:hypothetical protein